MTSKNDEIWGPGLIFDRQKPCQNDDFLVTCEIAFRIVKRMVLEGFGISETSKNDTEHRTQNKKKHSTQIHTKITNKNKILGSLKGPPGWATNRHFLQKWCSRLGKTALFEISYFFKQKSHNCECAFAYVKTMLFFTLGIPGVAQISIIS